MTSKLEEAAKQFALNPNRTAITIQDMFTEGAKWLLSQSETYKANAAGSQDYNQGLIDGQQGFFKHLTELLENKSIK